MGETAAPGTAGACARQVAALRWAADLVAGLAGAAPDTDVTAEVSAPLDSGEPPVVELAVWWGRADDPLQGPERQIATLNLLAARLRLVYEVEQGATADGVPWVRVSCDTGRTAGRSVVRLRVRVRARFTGRANADCALARYGPPPAPAAGGAP